jgi:hypothetical protein
MKFTYTTANNETAEYEALPLTSELYEQLIGIDREFLTEICNGNEPAFNTDEFKKIAAEMLVSFGKGKDVVSPKTSDENLILFVQNKKTPESIDLESDKEKQLSLKKILRSHFITSKIRSFKKKKIQLIQDLGN